MDKIKNKTKEIKFSKFVKGLAKLYRQCEKAKKEYDDLGGSEIKIVISNDDGIVEVK